jgi:hypothetical protein
VDIKRLVTHFTYRIEQKPDGGFIAHSSDPNLPPLEAPTRFELQHKIQDNIDSVLRSEFPGLNLPENKRVSFHLEKQADGTVAFHSSDPNSTTANAGTHEEVESHFAEKMFSLFGKQILSHLPPEMASQIPSDLAAQLNSGNVKVFVEKKVTRSDSPSGAAGQLTTTLFAPAPQSNSGTDSNFMNQATNASPITPERNSGTGMLRVLLALAVICGMLYLYLKFHH